MKPPRAHTAARNMSEDHATNRRVQALLAVMMLTALAVLTSSCQDDKATPTVELGGSGVSINGETWNYRGSAMSREIEMPAALLTRTDGTGFDVKSETQGFVTLLYVGYTHCPDLCPTHMASIAGALAELPAESAAKVRIVFVTSDPERDTPRVLGDWLAQFDSSFVGLTGSAETLMKFQQDLGMNRATVEEGNHEHEYSVSHASYVLAFPRHSRIALIAYPSSATSDDYLADLQSLTSHDDSDR